MEKFLQVVFPETYFARDTETTVQCPFHDDTVGSMHIRVTGDRNMLYHCKSCEHQGNSIDFMAAWLKTTPKAAISVLNILNNSLHDYNTWKEKLENVTKEHYDLLTKFGIKEEILKKSKAGSMGSGLSLPIFFGDTIVDVRTYIPDRNPKVKSLFNATTGFLVPDLALHKKTIILTEGEKDALTLLSNELPGVSITGGALAIPDKTPYLFDGKTVVILYDNDEAGKQGAQKVAHYLLSNKLINVDVRIADIAPLINNKEKGDVTDYFYEFNGTKQELLDKCIKVAEHVTLADVQTATIEKLKTISVKLEDADNFTGQWLSSEVQVSATVDSSYTIPKSLIMNISNIDDLKDYALEPQMNWVFDKYKNIQDVLYLIDKGNDNKFAKKVIDCSKAEFEIKASTERIPIYKVIIASNNKDTTASGKQATEHEAYVIGKSLESGKDYKISYKIIPNPLDGNKSIALVADAKDLAKEAENFKITDEVKTSLDKVSSLTFDQLIENAKGHINANFNDKLVTVSELTYNSVLEYNMDRFHNLKGCIDSIIVTDTGFGKSITAERLMKTYGVGTRVSLVGSAATPQGLIGGSKPVGGSLQTTAGVIPRNHKGLIMFEELGKNKSDILKDLTDIRTSGKAEIARVSGKISLPANLRMLFSSNPKSDSSGTNKTIDSYANGIEIIQDLLGAREDIGRFDLISILGQSESIEEDPFWTPTQHLTVEDMRNKINWIWSRKPDEIYFEGNPKDYIMEAHKELNNVFESSVQIFGRKTWLKVSKLAVAIAAYMASHSEDYTSIVVKKEHVKKACEIFRNLFDNKTFKLKEHVAQERAYTQTDEGSTAVMKRMYQNQGQLIQQLGLHSEILTRELETVANLNKEDFNLVLSDLVRFNLVRNSKGKILPTEKFRKTYEMINKEKPTTFPKTVDEIEMKGA